MKAAVMTAISQPLEMRDVPDPQPGPGQVRLRLQATGVCGTDFTSGTANCRFRCQSFLATNLWALSTAQVRESDLSKLGIVSE